MGNEGIYSVSKDLVKQNITFSQTKTFVGPSQVDFTHEIVAKMTVCHDSSSSSHVLYMWFFSRVVSRETLASQSRNPLNQSLKLNSLPISHTHPLQLNPRTYKEND